MDILFTLLPIVVIFLCLAVWSKPADISGVIGWVVTVVVVIFAFHTPLIVAMKASLTGILVSLPVTLVVATSIWQISFMESTGALKRVIVFIKTLSRDNQAIQIMLINIGFGTLLVSVGATPVSILPPIMVAMGYSTFLAVALPALGYDSLCTFSLLGAPVVIFSDLTNIPLSEAGLIFAKFLPVISTLLAFAMLWLVGRFALVKKGFLPALISGLVIGLSSIAMAHTSAVVLSGVVAGLGTIIAMLIYLKVTRQKIIDKSILSTEELQLAHDFNFLRAISPWLILIIATFITNFVPGIFDTLYNKLDFAVTVIPGAPVKTRFLWNAYTWIIISTLLSIPFLKASRKELTASLVKWRKRAPRPILAAAIFFAIAYVMNYSGFEVVGTKFELLNKSNNMIAIIATSSADLFKSYYPVVASYLGLLGGFVTGSESSAIAMFTKYNLNISDILKLNPAIITAGTAIGGGLASVISPAKLQNAAATIDAIGIENKVIRVSFLLALFLTTIAAILTFILS